MNKFLVAALLLGFATAAVAEDPGDLAKKIINDPGDPHVDGAKASLRDDPAVQGGKALRVQVAKKGANPWDAMIGGPVNKPIKAGDKLILAFWARLEKGENGATTTLPYNAVQLASAPYSTVISGSNDIGPDWKMYQVTGKSDRDYGSGQVKVTIQLATAKQTVDFGPIMLFDMGQ